MGMKGLTLRRIADECGGVLYMDPQQEEMADREVEQIVTDSRKASPGSLFAAIPGTIICGWLSDHVFKGRRALPTVIFMALVAIAVFIYWKNLDNLTVIIACLIAIGFFIYGPVMLIGVQALDLAPKNAAGTAAGLTGFLGYVLGTAILANIVIGFAMKNLGLDSVFMMLIAACVIAILLMMLTYKAEQYLVKGK